jgi:hypothetical protein
MTVEDRDEYNFHTRVMATAAIAEAMVARMLGFATLAHVVECGLMTRTQAHELLDLGQLRLEELRPTLPPGVADLACKLLADEMKRIGPPEASR